MTFAARTLHPCDRAERVDHEAIGDRHPIWLTQPMDRHVSSAPYDHRAGAVRALSVVTTLPAFHTVRVTKHGCKRGVDDALHGERVGDSCNAAVTDEYQAADVTTVKHAAAMVLALVIVASVSAAEGNVLVSR